MSFADELTMREHLRERFPPEQIGTLPRTDKRPALSYVGHAAVTDRLNRYAPDWTYTVDKLFNSGDATWIEGTITIGGVSRVEYGDGKTPKEAISDFVKRGAMRFGVALDLWSKEELESSPTSATRPDTEAGVGDPTGAGDNEPVRGVAPSEGAVVEPSSATAPAPSSEGVAAVDADAPGVEDATSSEPSQVIHMHGAWSTKTEDGTKLRTGWVRCTNLLPNGSVCGYAEKTSRVAKADIVEVPA